MSICTIYGYLTAVSVIILFNISTTTAVLSMSECPNACIIGSRPGFVPCNVLCSCKLAPFEEWCDGVKYKNLTTSEVLLCQRTVLDIWQQIIRDPINPCMTSDDEAFYTSVSGGSLPENAFNCL